MSEAAQTMQDEAQALLARLPLSDPLTQHIPAELTALPWVAYAVQERGGKVTKPPLDPKQDSPRFARVDKPESWAAFGEAMAFLSAHRGEVAQTKDGPAVVAGAGVVLSSGAGVTGIDIDASTGPDGAALEWAAPLVQALLGAGFYVERSPSGTGLRAFCKEPLPAEYAAGGKPDGFHIGKVEVYASAGKRYLTITGRRLDGAGTALPAGPECASCLSLLWKHCHPAEAQPAKAPQPKRPSDFTDAELLQKALQAKNGAEVERLFQRKPAQGEDNSAEDLRLANLLAFWCMGDPARLDRMMRQSARLQDAGRLAKWDKVHNGAGQTYGEMTVAKALEGRSEFFCPGTPSPSPAKGKDGQPAQDAPWHRDSAPAVAVSSDMPPLEGGDFAPSICAMLQDVAAVCSSGVELSFISFFSFLSALICGRGQIAVFRSNPVYLNTYVALVSKSGTAKSAMQNFYYSILFNALRKSETEYSRKKKEYEEALERWNLLPDNLKAQTKEEEKPQKPHKKKTDFIRGSMTLQGAVRRCDANPCGVNVVVDEMEQLFGGLDPSGRGNAGETKSFLLSAYDGATYSNARKAEEDELAAASCLLSIFGAVQPEKIPELFSLSDLFSGFLSRFVFILYEQTRAKRGNGGHFSAESWKTLRTVSDYIADTFQTSFDDKTSLPEPKHVKIDDDAKELFMEKYNAEQEKAWNLGLETGPVDKVSVQTEKFIALVHIANRAVTGGGELGSITREEVQACLPLWNWFYGNFLNVLARINAKVAKKDYISLGSRDRAVLATILRNAAPPKGRSLTVTVKDVAGWLAREGAKHPLNTIAFALRKLLKPNEIEASSNPHKHPNKYRIGAATLDRLRAVSLLLAPEDAPAEDEGAPK